MSTAIYIVGLMLVSALDPSIDWSEAPDTYKHLFYAFVIYDILNMRRGR